MALKLITPPALQSGIYKITCIATGKVYIGSSVNVKKRRQQHMEGLNNGKHHSQLLQRAWNKYGKENFKFTVIVYVPEELLIEQEQHYIDLYHAADRNYGYNISPAAGTVRGIKRPNANWGRILSEETKQKIAKSLTGFKHSPEAKKNMSESNKGKKKKPMSKEQKRKLSEIKRGRHPNITPEFRVKLSEKMKGNKFRLGACTSEETKEKLRIAMLGKKNALGAVRTDEEKAKMSEFRKGKPLKVEHRAKISNALTGKKKTPEHCLKLALSQAKLTQENIKIAIEWRKQGMLVSEICKKLGCSRQTFYDAINGKKLAYRREVVQ